MMVSKKKMKSKYKILSIIPIFIVSWFVIGITLSEYGTTCVVVAEGIFPKIWLGSFYGCGPTLTYDLGFFVIPQAFACECKETTKEQRIENAQVIFSGRLKGDIWEFSGHHIAANFAVKIVWKGATDFPLIETGDVTVVTAVDSGLCGVKFIPEKTYLIYAQIDEDILRTSSCSGSWFLDGKGDEIRMLNEIGSTHHFIDARDLKGSSSDDCKRPGLQTVEQCEFEKLIRNVFMLLGISVPIVGVTVFLFWRKRK